MKTKAKEKKYFDALKELREIRDKISLETADMTFEQLKAYLERRRQIAAGKEK